MRHDQCIGIDLLHGVVACHVEGCKVLPAIGQIALFVPELACGMHHAVTGLVAHLHPGYRYAGLLEAAERLAHVVGHGRLECIHVEAFPV